MSTTPTKKKSRVQGPRDISQAIMLRSHEIYKHYGIKQPTLSRWCSDGLVKSVKLGSRGGRRGTLLVYKDSFEAYLAANEQKAGKQMEPL